MRCGERARERQHAVAVGGLPEVVSALEPGLVMAGFDARELAAGLRDALTGRLALPTEDACVRYAERFELPVRSGVKVDRLWREADRFRLSAGSRCFNGRPARFQSASWALARWARTWPRCFGA